jgi:hypothetical protein
MDCILNYGKFLEDHTPQKRSASKYIALHIFLSLKHTFLSSHPAAGVVIDALKVVAVDVRVRDHAQHDHAHAERNVREEGIDAARNERVGDDNAEEDKHEHPAKEGDFALFATQTSIVIGWVSRTPETEQNDRKMAPKIKSKAPT